MLYTLNLLNVTCQIYSLKKKIYGSLIHETFNCLKKINVIFKHIYIKVFTSKMANNQSFSPKLPGLGMGNTIKFGTEVG